MKHLVLTLLTFCSLMASAQNAVVKRQTTKSVVKTKSQTASSPLDKILVGTHLLSLSWISWEDFGTVKISKTGKKNVYKIAGMQESRYNDDYLKIQGTITAQSKTLLLFHGKIIQKISFFNNGQPCIREGKYHFLQTEGRHYWRMQEMTNPCDGESCDYVDIYLK